MSAPESLAPASGATLAWLDGHPHDPIVGAMMLRALRDAGFVLVEAGDGREALGLVRADAAPFDLVITDVATPPVDGLLETRGGTSARRQRLTARGAGVSGYSTVTDFARFRGWSTLHPRATAT